MLLILWPDNLCGTRKDFVPLALLAPAGGGKNGEKNRDCAQAVLILKIKIKCLIIMIFSMNYNGLTDYLTI